MGAGPYPSETILPVALARFVTAHPLIRVRVLVRGDWDELLRRLRAREVDFLVCEVSTLEGEHDLDIAPLPPHRLYFIGRRGHPLGRRAAVRLRHALAYPLVAMSRIPPRVLQPMMAALPQLDAQPPRRPFPAIELASLAAVKRLLEKTDAIAPLPLPCVFDEVERGTLAVLMAESWLATNYGFVSLKGQPLSAPARALVERLREAEAALEHEQSRLLARQAPAQAMRASQRRRNAR